MILYRIARTAWKAVAYSLHKFMTIIHFWGNDVKHGSFRTHGVPYVMVKRGGSMTIGNNFAMNNGIAENPIGTNRRCIFLVERGAEIRIGENVGLSQTALVSMNSIEIQDRVKIGGGTVVYTSDFHSLDPQLRASDEDKKHRKGAPVVIEHDAFIGAQCIILKGVTIGACSIVGAGSVVTKNIPPNEIWAGNPARFIRKIQKL